MRRYAMPAPRRKNGSVWQIIYMDLMTMVMVFFVILWSINQDSEAAVSDTLGEETTRMIDLPANVLFSPGKAKMTASGKEVFNQLFADDTGSVLDFDTGGLTKRLLFVHGHTDADGKKDENFRLGYRRAYAAYKEIEKHGSAVADHVVLCTHADNSPAVSTPAFQGKLTPAQRAALREAKATNRRITIEDKVVSTLEDE